MCRCAGPKPNKTGRIPVHSLMSGLKSQSDGAQPVLPDLEPEPRFIHQACRIPLTPGQRAGRHPDLPFLVLALRFAVTFIQNGCQLKKAGAALRSKPGSISGYITSGYRRKARSLCT